MTRAAWAWPWLQWTVRLFVKTIIARLVSLAPPFIALAKASGCEVMSQARRAQANSDAGLVSNCTAYS